MDAIEFLKEKERMCKACGSCLLCPAWLDDGCSINVRSGFAPEQQINIVKEWSAAHPRKTRQSVFLEQYPEASISEHGVLLVCPCPISASHRNANGGCATIGRRCDDCRKEYWMQEVE